ncbi:hypothetical protein BC941DRAFT_497600 [Chlamydoabsidia padenii]|nr:hypothetical protein BC941DRAFT_497600 [Chlamydoabsidia padenii]
MAIAPPPTLYLQQQWLPTLSSIVLDGDSFSTELIRQFDKKRSRLQAEMVGENVSLSSDSYQSRARTPERVESIPQINTPPAPSPPSLKEENNNNNNNDISSQHLRRRSAGDLLRRSSAYLRAKFEVFKTIPPPPPSPQQQQRASQDLITAPPPEEQRTSVFHSWSLSKKSPQHRHPHADTIFDSNSHDPQHPSTSSLSSQESSPPTKIAVNTTISIPPPPQQQRHSSLYHYTTTVQPPVITQYPPRPLKYAPVEPISDDDIPYHNNSTVSTNTPIHTNTNEQQSLEHKSNTHHHHHHHHHRISLPLFRMMKDPVISSSPSQHSRRSSDSDIHRLATTKPSSSWTRRFSQWFHCHQPNKTTTPTKKGKEPATKTTRTDATTRGTTNMEVHSLAI